MFADAVRRVAAGGSALDPEVVSHLLAGRSSPDDAIAQLTPRETEVMARIAEGLSNGAIATRLQVSERGVERHVTSIFEKLGLPADGESHRRVLAVPRHVQDPWPPGNRSLAGRPGAHYPARWRASSGVRDIRARAAPHDFEVSLLRPGGAVPPTMSPIDPFVCRRHGALADAAWVHLAGELDVATAPQLDARCARP